MPTGRRTHFSKSARRGAPLICFSADKINIENCGTGGDGGHPPGCAVLVTLWTQSHHSLLSVPARIFSIAYHEGLHFSLWGQCG